MTIFRVHQAQQPFRDVVNAVNSQCFSRCWSREQGDLALPNLLCKRTQCAEWWVNGCVAWTCVRLCQAISLAGGWRGAHPRFQVILAMRTMVLCLHSDAHHGHSVRSSIWANKFMERLIPNPCWYLHSPFLYSAPQCPGSGLALLTSSGIFSHAGVVIALAGKICKQRKKGERTMRWQCDSSLISHLLLKAMLQVSNMPLQILHPS